MSEMGLRYRLKKKNYSSLFHKQIVLIKMGKSEKKDKMSDKIVDKKTEKSVDKTVQKKTKILLKRHSINMKGIGKEGEKGEEGKEREKRKEREEGKEREKGKEGEKEKA